MKQVFHWDSGMDIGTTPSLAAGLERRIAQLTRLMELSQSIVAQLDRDSLFQKIVDTATMVVNAQVGGLLVLSDDERKFEFFKVSGVPDPPPIFPSGVGILSHPCRQGTPIRVDDVRRHPQAVGFPPDHLEIGPFLSVPLKSSRHCLGALFVGNAPGAPVFSAEDEELLQIFAGQAAIAIENARLYAKAEELARLQERQRIAAALHETLAQMLFTIDLETEWCARHLSLGAEAQHKLQTVRHLTARCTDELRSAIFALRSPTVPEHTGLVALLQDQVAQFRAESGLAATLIVPPQFGQLPPLVTEAVYRIVREALTNVHKHAHASAAMVSIHRTDGAVTVTIQDNGVGLEQPVPQTGDDYELHIGIATMRQLTAQAQGDLIIVNNDDEGVMVKARFPIPEEGRP